MAARVTGRAPSAVMPPHVRVESLAPPALSDHATGATRTVEAMLMASNDVPPHLPDARNVFTSDCHRGEGALSGDR